MKVVDGKVARGEEGQEFALYAKLDIDPGEYRAMPSERLRQALLGSFVRLCEALTREFESLLGPDFRLISMRQLEVCQEEKRFAAVVQIRVESTSAIAEALLSHWMLCAGNWVHVMGLEFPMLRGATSVGITDHVRDSRTLAGEAGRRPA